MTYLLEPATLEDLPDMVAWEGQIFGSDAWSPELLVAEVSHPANYYLVARHGQTGDLAGYAGVRVDPAPGGHADIQTIAILPQHRGVGLGTHVLAALLEYAEEKGAIDVFLDVRADNEAALALYASAGFERIDTRVGYYQPDGIDAVVMRRVLAPRQGIGPVGS